MLAARNVFFTAGGVSIVAVAAVDAASITLPAHEAGNLIILHTVRDGSSTPPTAPGAGGTVPTWSNVPNCANTGGTAISTRTVQTVASANNHTSGTFTNCSSIIAVVLSGQHASPIGGSLETGAGTGTPAAPSITMTTTDGTSILLHFETVRATASWGSAPAGYTSQATNIRSSLITKDDTTSDGSVARSVSGYTGTQYRGATIEVLTA